MLFLWAIHIKLCHMGYISIIDPHYKCLFANGYAKIKEFGRNQLV
jgi:hypothetical protein